MLKSYTVSEVDTRVRRTASGCVLLKVKTFMIDTVVGSDVRIAVEGSQQSV